jgi:hypothetical protein
MFDAPEYESVEALAQFLCDDDRTVFSHEDLSALNYRMRRTVQELRRELESYGLTLAVREPARRVRGVTSNSHDRWFGPGSCKSHGGSGHEQISGFAGQRG